MRLSNAEYHRNYYHTKRDIKKLLIQKKERRNKIKESIDKYLQEHPCVDCNESNIIVLDFDHIKNKTINISDAKRRGWSLIKILKEIENCEVRCANCHRKKTAERSAIR